MTDVVIRTTVEHAEAVADLLDLATRIHMGQLEEISSLAMQHALLARASADNGSGIPLDRASTERLDAILLEAKAILGHSRNGSFGIGSSGTGLRAKRGYEVMKAVKQALHHHLRPDQYHSVDRDGIIVRYAPGDVPTASVVSE